MSLTYPTNFDANNYPLGTYLRLHANFHFLFHPKIPDTLVDFSSNPINQQKLRFNRMGSNHIASPFKAIGIVAESPNPKKKFLIYCVGSDQQILEGVARCNSQTKSLYIGKLKHYPIQGPDILDLGVQIDIFAVAEKVEILQAGETERVKVPSAKRAFVPN